MITIDYHAFQVSLFTPVCVCATSKTRYLAKLNLLVSREHRWDCFWRRWVRSKRPALRSIVMEINTLFGVTYSEFAMLIFVLLSQ